MLALVWSEEQIGRMGPEPFESKLDFSFQDLFELGVVLQGMMDCSMVAGMLSSRLSGI